MTDKQIPNERRQYEYKTVYPEKSIVIDGVDVSGCDYYNKINKHTGQYCICELEPNCSYKQFKRSEAQCEAMFVSHTDLEKKYKTKEQECERLDNEAQNLFTEKTNLEIELTQLKAERDSYIDKYFLESQKVINLKKVLIEIKEIAERDKEFCIKCNGDKEIDCIECIEGGRALLAKDILQKIGEV